MNAPMSDLAKALFSSKEESTKVLSKMRLSDSYFGEKVIIKGHTYVISSGDMADIDEAIATIEKEINEYSSQ